MSHRRFLVDGMSLPAPGLSPSPPELYNDRDGFWPGFANLGKKRAEPGPLYSPDGFEGYIEAAGA
jgi:hypothetical protein